MTNKLRTNNIDRVVVTFEEMKKIIRIIEKYGNKSIGENVEYIRDVFNEVMIVTVPDNYEQLSRFSVAIGSKPLRKQAIYLKKDCSTGKMLPQTGWLDHNGEFEYVHNTVDYGMVEDAVIILTYIFLMSEKESDTGKIVSYDKTIKCIEHENKVTTMKKNHKNKLVRKVKIERKKEYTFNIPDGDEKRAYNRMCESWGVRGHWRHYKNGHKKWIAGYPKGEGRKEAKEYTLK